MAVLLLLVLLMLLSGWYVEYGVFVIARALLLLVTWLGLAAEYGCCWLVVLVEVEEEVQEEASCAPQLSLALTLVVALVKVVVALLLMLLLVVAVTAGDLLLVDELGDCNVCRCGGRCS